MNTTGTGTRPDMWRHPGNKPFEDLNKGDRFVTAARTMAEADIQNYAGISGDFHAYHTNEVVAREGAFGGRIAHGLLSLSVLSGLFRNRLGLFDSVDTVSLGVSKLRFLKPVRAGDTIHAVLEVADLRESRSHPDSGIVMMQITGTNQDGDKVLECEWTELVGRRSATATAKSMG
jgi:3-hydroxybutyryl-CoA dehydratase